MDDSRIIDLYWARSEEALSETDKKYGRYCRYIANNILHSDFEVEECVNDTYMSAWKSIPPHRPERLSCFLAKLTRNNAINRYKHDRRKKRSAELELILDELNEVIADPRSETPPEYTIALREAINEFLASLTKDMRVVFIRRYWYLSSISEIAVDRQMTESNVKVMLHRARERLRVYLERDGIIF